MHYINGLWVDKGSHRFASENPATGKVIWEGWAAGEAEVKEAVKAARDAFATWSTTDYSQRYDLVRRFKELVESKKEELAVLIAQETGKALWDSRSEVAAVVAKLTYSSEAYEERTGTKSRTSPVGNSVVRHRPHGVMAVFAPYNFPAHLPNGHIMPALLAGNTVVLKPSELTPKVGEWYIKQWEIVGIPPGVLNLVQGEKDTGIVMAKAEVDGILFTGSSATGKILHQQLAGRPEVVLALEMGGNNPLIVSKVSDLKAAVHETILSAYTGTGQRCTCARRLIIIEDGPWVETYLELLKKAAKSLQIGAYDETPEPFMGPLINKKEANRLLEAQDKLVKLGGKILLPMQLIREGLPFVSAGLIDMTKIANVPDEEYFGPLLQIYRVKTREEAIQLANNTKYGLSAAILCDDPALFQLLSTSLKAGLINWNRQTTGASGAGPFGGIGLSGNHRPAGYYAADYCAYPVASVEAGALVLPEKLPPGLTIER